MITNQTKVLRTKEQLLDYRFLNEPDLLPLLITDDDINQIKENLPELPNDIRNRYKNDYQLNNKDIEILLSTPYAIQYFDQLMCNIDYKSAKIAANWLINELLGILNSNNIPLIYSPITFIHLQQLINKIIIKEISGKIGKKILHLLLKLNKKDLNNKNIIDHIIKKNDWQMITNINEINKLCQIIINKYPNEIIDYQNTK